jgi:hypothetical protein
MLEWRFVRLYWRKVEWQTNHVVYYFPSGGFTDDCLPSVSSALDTAAIFRQYSDSFGYL